MVGEEDKDISSHTKNHINICHISEKPYSSKVAKVGELVSRIVQTLKKSKLILWKGICLPSKF